MFVCVVSFRDKVFAGAIDREVTSVVGALIRGGRDSEGMTPIGRQK